MREHAHARGYVEKAGFRVLSDQLEASGYKRARNGLRVSVL
jgi:hypothetical protein